MKHLLLAVAVFLIISCSVAQAFTVTLTGAMVRVEYTEPIDNEDGSITNDLNHCELFYDVGAGAVKGMDIPASSPAGGADMSASLEIPVISGQEVDVKFWLTAVDLSGNSSKPSELFFVRIDRLAPNPPR